MAWDTHARRKIDLVGRKDAGDRLITHEFDHSVKNQVRGRRPVWRELAEVWCLEELAAALLVWHMRVLREAR